MKEINKISDLAKDCFNKNKPLKLLGIYAHPDDEVINISGLLAKARSEKMSVYLICLSRGGKGFVIKKSSEEKLKKEREKEFYKVGDLFNCTEAVCLDFPDGEFINYKNKIKELLINSINRIKPRIIVTHDPSGLTGHPDHIITSQLVYSILKEQKKKNNLYFSVLGEHLKLVSRTRITRLTDWKSMPEPTYRIDIKNYFDIIKKAYKIYKSQALNKAKPIDLKIWFNFFDREYLHQVKWVKKYKFRLVKFKSKYFTFDPKRRTNYD